MVKEISTCFRILFDVNNIVWKFNPKAFLSKDSWGIIRVDAPKQEVVCSICNGAFVPRQGARRRGRASYSKVINPTLSSFRQLESKTKIAAVRVIAYVLLTSNAYERSTR